MVQVIEMTREEKMKMYMKLPKKQLAEMLIESNRLLSMKQIVYAEAEAGRCDVCGNRPSVFVSTEFGQFCQAHAKYI